MATNDIFIQACMVLDLHHLARPKSFFIIVKLNPLPIFNVTKYILSI